MNKIKVYLNIVLFYDWTGNVDPQFLFHILSVASDIGYSKNIAGIYK